MNLLHLYFLLIIASSSSVLGDMFSSIEHLKYLHENEIFVIKEYKELLKNVKEYSLRLEKKIQHVELEHKKFIKDIDNYVMNPLSAFLLIKRLSFEIESEEISFKQIIQNFRESLVSYTLPKADFEGAVEGFLRLQKVYGLKSQDLANGIIEDRKMREALTGNDLYALGTEIMKTDKIYGQEYLSMALNQTCEIPKYEILKQLLQSYKETKNYQAAVSVVDEMLKINPGNDYLQDEKLELKIKSILKNDNLKNNTEEDLSGSHYSEDKDFLILSETCKGNRQQNTSVTSKLYCFIQSKTFFTKIAPFKVEVMNLEPEILVFHEIISDNEIQSLKSISALILSRAEIFNENSTNSISNIRVAKLSWHYDGSHKVLDTLNKRVGDMSGLNMATAEMWQIQNYGIGGHYAPHFDFFNNVTESKIANGNRIATMLLYLSDVEKGGATVFPFLRLRVSPRKGTAVFWHNLNSSGNKEYLTLHSACPVLLGSKWVANKWLHEQGQEFSKPCELEEKLAVDDYKQKYYIL